MSRHHRLKHFKIAVRNCVMSALTPPVLAMAGAIPPQTRRRLARLAAKCLAAFNTPPYRTALANIAVAMPDLDGVRRAALARESLQNIVLTGLEVMHIIRHPGWVTQAVEPPTPEILALFKDKAVIGCIPHLGNWEVIAQAFPTFGLAVSAVAEPLGNQTLTRRLFAAREANGLQLILRDGAARKVLRALHEKRAVGLLVDQNVSPRDGGEFTRFFGLPATFSPLPAALARKLDVPIVVFAAVRTPEGKFRFECTPLPRPAAEYPSAEAVSQEIQNIFQKIILQHPEQYTWLYHRWRYIPRNAPDSLAEQFPFYAVRRPYDAPQDVLDNTRL